MTDRKIGALLGWLIAGLFLAGLLAPPLYWGLASLVAGGLLPAGGSIAFERVLRRCLLLVALIGLGLWLRFVPRQQWGLYVGWHDQQWLKHLASATLAAIGGLGLALGGLWSFGWLGWSHLPLAQDVLAAIGLAVFVAVVEETLFRGALFGWLRRHSTWPVACLLASVLFIVPHFLHIAPQATQRLFGDGVIGWSAGLRLLPALFAPLQDLAAIWPHGICLLVLANSCHWLVVQTGSVAAAIGFHGGLVFALKLAQVSFVVLAPSYWLTADFRGGLVPTFVIWSSCVCLCLGMHRVARPRLPTHRVDGWYWRQWTDRKLDKPLDKLG